MVTEVLLDSDSILDAAASSLAGGKGIILGRRLAGAAIVTRVLTDPRKKGFAEGLAARGQEVLGRFLPVTRPPRDTRGWRSGEIVLLGKRAPGKGKPDVREIKGAVLGSVGGNGFRLEAFLLLWVGPGPQRTWKRLPVLYPRDEGNPPPPTAPSPPAPVSSSHEKKR